MKTWKFIEENLEKWLLILSLIAMVLIVVMQVFLRWLDRPTVWAEEVARYIMLYQVWIGAAYAVHEDAHIRITALINRSHGNVKKSWELVVLFLWLVFSVWLTVEGVILVGKINHMGQVSPALQMPMVIPYASVPIGGALMTIRLIQKVVQTLKDKPEEKEVA